MLLSSGRPNHRGGQAILLVMVFLAAFLFLIWAALRLASSGFINLAVAQADTRTTYALDSGVDYAMEYIAVVQGGDCISMTPPALTFTYPSTTITVNLTVTPAAICNSGPATWDLVITASDTSRRLKAEVVLDGGLWSINWQGYQ